MRRGPNVEFGAANNVGFPHARGRELEHRPERYTPEGPADWWVGAFLVLRCEALLAARPFEEVGLLRVQEELRVLPARPCGRLRGAALPAADGQTSPPAGTCARSCGAYSKVLYARKQLPDSSRVALRTAMALGHGARALRLVLARRRRPDGRARLQGEARAAAVAVGIAGAPLRAT